MGRETSKEPLKAGPGNSGNRSRPTGYGGFPWTHQEPRSQVRTGTLQNAHPTCLGGASSTDTVSWCSFPDHLPCSERRIHSAATWRDREVSLCGTEGRPFPRVPHSLVSCTAQKTEQGFKELLHVEETLRLWYQQSSLQLKEWEKKLTPQLNKELGPLANKRQFQISYQLIYYPYTTPLKGP